MASNRLPNIPGQTIGLGTNMLAGLNALGLELAITQITPAAFEAKLNAFITCEGNFNACRSERQAALDVWVGATDAVYDWLLVVRTVLAGRFGNRWSTEWAQAGFTNASSSVPKKIENQLALALSLVGFFTANPTWQVATMGVTAAQGTALRAAALAAQQAVLGAEGSLVEKGTQRETAQGELVSMMRALIKILGATIAGNDPRWLAFGLHMPATNTTPGQPLNLTATLDQSGAIILQCDAVPLATRYRWRMQMVGVETAYELAARSTAPLAAVRGVLPGHTVNFIVQAVNGSQQGVASAAVNFTVPLTMNPPAEARGKASAPVEREALEKVSNGNGGGYGHAVRTR